MERSLRFAIERHRLHAELSAPSVDASLFDELTGLYHAERERSENDLKESLERTLRILDGTIMAMATTVELKDPYTAGHERRVSQIACAIAREMGIAEDQIEGLRTAASLHDIGKITVPGEILCKPGKLSELEFGLIATHCQVGYEILRTIEFPWPVAQIVLQHQERLNGSGYPSGLQGEEILLEARILAIADVVESMSSHRPYRPALGMDKAKEELLKNRGILYDTDVVDAWLQIITEKGFNLE